MQKNRAKNLIVSLVSLAILALSFACLVIFQLSPKNSQVYAQTVNEQTSNYQLSSRAIPRNVKLIVYYEELNGGKGGIYSKGLDGGYAYTDNEDTQKLNYELTFNSGTFDKFYLKASTGYVLKDIYSNFDEQENSFSGDVLEKTQQEQIYVASLGETTQSTFYVVFAKKRLTISIENDTLCRVSGGGSYLYGAQADLRFIEESENFQFVKWTKVLGDTEQDFSTSSNYSFTITENLIIKVKCKYLLKILENEHGSVLVKVNNVLTNQKYFDPNTELEITANAKVGYNFVNWTNEDFSNKEQTFTFTLVKPETVGVVFESKKVQVSITSDDIEHCSSQNSTSVENVQFVIGDSLNINFVIDSLFALRTINTNASGEFNRTLLSQEYKITDIDAENGEIYFIAKIYKSLSEIKLTISGYGTIQIGDVTYSSSQTIYLSSTSNFSAIMNPQSMFESEKIIYHHQESNDEFPVVDNKFSKVFAYDGDLIVMFRHKLWYDERILFEGHGTKQSPYLIKTPQELAYMAYAINYDLTPQDPECVKYDKARYKIVNNLDLEGRFWILIGANNNAKFLGVIDTNYKTIKNVYVVSDYSKFASFSKLFTETNGKVLKLEHDLGLFWQTIGILSSIFFGIALLVVVLLTILSNNKVKKVVVLNDEVIDKKS